MATLPESELILNDNGSVYHLQLKPSDLAEKIITVGDPARVDKVVKHFDKVLLEIQAREFKTVTGEIGDKTLSVISTGIGTDNIDIVLNEIDALFNIDLESREIKSNHTSLQLMRLGTSGSIQRDVPVDSLVISKMATGLEGLMLFYNKQESESEKAMSNAVDDALSLKMKSSSTVADDKLVSQFNQKFIPVNTITATGFYAPQGRQLRLKPSTENLIERISAIRSEGEAIHNLEMETAGIYGLSKLLGHQAISISAILANRIDHTFSKQANKTVENMIKAALELWVSC